MQAVTRHGRTMIPPVLVLIDGSGVDSVIVIAAANGDLVVPPEGVERGPTAVGGFEQGCLYIWGLPCSHVFGFSKAPTSSHTACFFTTSSRAGRVLPYVCMWSATSGFHHDTYMTPWRLFFFLASKGTQNHRFIFLPDINIVPFYHLQQRAWSSQRGAIVFQFHSYFCKTGRFKVRQYRIREAFWEKSGRERALRTPVALRGS